MLQGKQQPPLSARVFFPSDRQREIFQTATRLFLTQGYKKTTVRKIAQTMDIAPSMVIYYFGNKQNIALTFLQTKMQQLIDEVHPLVNISENPEVFCCTAVRLFQTVMASSNFYHFYHEMIEEKLFHKFFFTADGEVNSTTLIMNKYKIDLSPLQANIYSHYIMPSIEMALWIAVGQEAPSEEILDLSFRAFMGLLRIPADEVDIYCETGKTLVKQILEKRPDFLAIP